MDMVPTLDILLADPTTDRARLVMIARAAMAAAVAEWSALRTLEREVRPNDWLAAEDRSVAIAFHRQHEAWSTAADALWRCVRDVIARVGPIDGVDPFRDAVGRTAARLEAGIQGTIDSLRASRDGQPQSYVTLEELRRELLHPGVPRPSQGAAPAVGPVAAGGGA